MCSPARKGAVTIQAILVTYICVVAVCHVVSTLIVWKAPNHACGITVMLAIALLIYALVWLAAATTFAGTFIHGTRGAAMRPCQGHGVAFDTPGCRCHFWSGHLPKSCHITARSHALQRSIRLLGHTVLLRFLCAGDEGSLQPKIAVPLCSQVQRFKLSCLAFECFFLSTETRTVHANPAFQCTTRVHVHSG